MKSTITFLFLCTLCGCSNELTKHRPIEQIFSNLLIEGEILVSYVQGGDVLHIKVKGTEIQNIFDKIYSKTTTASWFKWGRIGPGAYDHGSDYDWIKKQGVCKLHYRDLLEKVERPLNSLDDSPALQIKIGNSIHDLSDDFYLLGNTFFATLIVSPKMVEGGDELSVEFITPKPQRERVGFMGFGHCPGQKRKGFSVASKLLKHQFIKDQGKRQYQISLGVRRYKVH